ncbi:prolyl-tRNA synthetase [bacterium]|nr:prolyl-tRNA synthetase [bacterium]
MRQSQLFVKTSREFPKDEASKSAQFLLRAGFIDKLAAGIYTYLPLGLRVLEKIERIIDNEMKSIGAQRILMPSLIPKVNWQTTGRWNKFDALYKLKGKNKLEYALGATHEEVVVPLVKKHVSSWRDLPLAVFQIQNKFRNEFRAKSGILRTREFLMKDLYSFHRSEEELDKFYQKVQKAYNKIFKKVGILSKTYLTLAPGGTFSKYSHEYQTITSAGEDLVYFCPKCKVALNKELVVNGAKPKCWRCKRKLSEQYKSIEVANIFKLKEKYTKPFDFRFTDKDGKKKLVLMGCYGIGLGRLMGAVIEIWHDDFGIIWPKSIAPFEMHLIRIGESKGVKEKSEEIYRSLQKAGHEVIYDDRIQITPGEKFMDCDLIGIPLRIVVSEKTLKKNSVEIKKRNQKKLNFVKINHLLRYLENN